MSVTFLEPPTHMPLTFTDGSYIHKNQEILDGRQSRTFVDEIVHLICGASSDEWDRLWFRLIVSISRIGHVRTRGFIRKGIFFFLEPE
ncbi:hypothetical protein AVEN_22516-1 [Araneus ventricosus]|uniref:Uncharacterized protein n=1 Tax=Araneus ventricosus TaxID=182803 RepID=A0A4Y2UVC6_ARAVE|nr:hypothetical protein AVEN_22516-1 [Araneus ventricosus]